MALIKRREKQPIRLAEFYTSHVKKMSYVVIAMLIATNVAMTVLLVQYKVNLEQMVFLIIVPVVSFEVFALMIILKFALEPLEIITRVIARLSNQPSDLTAPHINDPRYVKSGLKEMVQTIYDRVQEPVNDQVADKSADLASRYMLDRLPCGIIGINEKGEITYANSKAPLFTDHEKKPTLQLVFPEGDSLESWLESTNDDKVTSTHRWSRIPSTVSEENERRLFDIIAYYEKSAGGGIETMIVTIDQTEVYQDDQQAVDFISLAAHELRGPITVIRGYLDVLADEIQTTITPDQRELIERLDVSASRLSGYVNNILNVAKYDRQHLRIHLQEDSLYDIYLSISDDLALRARTQNRLLSVSIPQDLPKIAADRNSLSEVIANLVDNAIKYSHEGGNVSISANIEGNFVKFNVQDRGIGMPTAVMNGLFKKFYRSHRSRSSVAGTGLGLYISRGIIESHGGQIGLTSTEGQGSTFYFTVPIYSTVAQKLQTGDNENTMIIKSSSGWIRNHSRIGG